MLAMLAISVETEPNVRRGIVGDDDVLFTAYREHLSLQFAI
jgi:hypothetical protein